jgi:PAT family beta-lactamase induction signal transducer AmpG
VTSPHKKIRHPLVWVPSLYFAQGLPYAVVSTMALFMYKKMGVPNTQITEWLALLGMAWVVKPLWSPFLEVIKSKKAVVILFQVVGGFSLLATAYTLRLPGFFTASIACLALTAFSSATHDIASDGSYIENLSTHEQSLYSGWQGAFWNGGKLLVRGGLVWLAGQLESTLSVDEVWAVVMAIPGCILLVLAVYHTWAMPSVRTVVTQSVSVQFIATTMLDVIITFFKKPGIWLAVAFIILFRAGEGQVQTIGNLFLIEARATGGLGLSTSEVATVYGTFGTVAFIAGSILGGYFAAWRGLKKAMFLMILAMNVPNLTFWYLSAYLPTNIYLITGILSFEMLGYGFGFVGLTLYIMQVVAPGKYPTAHYALGTGIMQLGFLLFQWKSGAIQEWMGYHNFFIWGVVSALPVLIMSLLVKIDVKEKGSLVEDDDPEPVAVPG